MIAKSFEEKLQQYAHDIYDAEVKLGGRLPHLIEQVKSERLRKVLLRHLRESKRRTARMQTALYAPSAA